MCYALIPLNNKPMNREIRKKMNQIKKDVLAKQVPSEKQIKAVKCELVDGLPPVKARMEAGYTESSAGNGLSKKKGYEAIKRPLIELIESVANLASARLEGQIKAQKKIGVRDLAYTMDVAVKNNRLLKGQSTENVGDRITFFIPEYNAQPKGTEKMAKVTAESEAEAEDYTARITASEK